MDNYAVIGHPISHSKSPQIHTAFAKQTQQNMTYTAIEAPLDGFIDTLKSFEAAGGKGVSVTLPFKQAAYEAATHRSQLADEAGAANTLAFQKNNEVYADNTDGPGLVQDITHNHDYFLSQKNLLILGAGGAVKGIMGPLLRKAPARLDIANRTPEKAIDIATQFSDYGEVHGMSLNEIPQEPYDLVINATSASITGHLPNISPHLIGKHTWCYDLFYSDEPTAFLKWAEHLGAEKCIDGLGMLIEQAAAAFYLWRGIYPDTRPVINMLRT